MQTHKCAFLDPCGDQCRNDEHCQYKFVSTGQGFLGPVLCGKDQIIKIQSLESRKDLTQIIENLEGRLALEGKAQQDQNLRLSNIEKEIKDQREDYHSHIRQLVTENETKHKNFSAELSQVAADTNKALIALKQTNDVAREASNRQATVITKLHNQIREQGDDILELKKRILAIEEKKAGRPRKARS